MSIILRKATRADIPALKALIARSARSLSTADYRHEQIESALRGAFGVDSQLIDDGTYFVATETGAPTDPGATQASLPVGCGGWSYRATLFGGDASKERDASRLDPTAQAAKIRAFFVDPDHARRGIATLLLERCEEEARNNGFSRVELMATLPGVKLYAARGYISLSRVDYDLDANVSIEFVPMRKDLRLP